MSDERCINISPWHPLVRGMGVPCHARWLGGWVLILSYVTDKSQASIFSQFPSHPFPVRKCWEARPLKTVNRQLGFANPLAKTVGFPSSRELMQVLW